MLREHGYPILSVAGTSMGALVGGLYAAGKMDEMKEMAHDLTRMKTFKLMDFSPGLNHLASGERFEALLHRLLGDVCIQQLPIPFACVASDVVSGHQKVFTDGPLALAIRASVSIPCFFKPVEQHGHLYVDGSVHDTLPLDVVKRSAGDVLVAVNASAPDARECRWFSSDGTAARGNMSWWKRSLPLFKAGLADNSLSMAVRVAGLSVQQNTLMALRITPPELCVDVPMDRFGLFDFAKADEIIAYGREQTERLLKAHGPLLAVHKDM